MIKDLKKVKHQVPYVLERVPEARDDDKVLWLAVMVQFYGLRKDINNFLHEPYLAFKGWFLGKKIPSMESVRRVRQKVQEKGQFRGTKWRKRHAEEKKVREWVKD